LLFNSFEFIFLFLPITSILYFSCARLVNTEAALGILVIASLFFYGYWNPPYLLLILFSITFNYLWGQTLTGSDGKGRKGRLIAGVALNLSLLAYFKYANFFVDNLNLTFGTNWHLSRIFLPLAISFFTFQQISYLIDSWQGKTREHNFLHYSLFVSFFPQLIAGPIVHHREMLPQFVERRNIRPHWGNFAVGFSIFSIGLFKKTVIADSLSVYVGPVFDTPVEPAQLEFFSAWGGTLAYTFQLYFDFSGYSDMAVGCARIFGIRLPVNFFSPYKAANIADFWRRWHITLSRFLRDYLYIALGGNRKGPSRRYVNLFLTMLLGGLWHGAGWTFVIWGALHGTYLIVNHAWSYILTRANLRPHNNLLYRFFAWLITFLAAVFAWVYFRATTIEQANEIVLAMGGYYGAALPSGIVARIEPLLAQVGFLGIGVSQASGSMFVTNFAWVVAAAMIAFFAPNVAQMFSDSEPVLYENKSSFKGQRIARRVPWRQSIGWALLSATLAVCGVLTLTQVTEFLYFQF
jgi:D-alanyl-lipoteichoic acid acyltransferase DltB (MBOAT superfamily)